MRHYQIVEMHDDSEQTIALCTELDHAERIIGALRAVRNELSKTVKADYGIATFDGELEWEIR